MNILVTGGAGFIGSHTLVSLIEAGHNPVVIDNFSNSSPEALRRVEKLVGRKVESHAIDLADEVALERVFTLHAFDAVIHFAGLKAVGESVQQPLRYYRVNLDSTLTLLETMERHGCHRLVFSSSATVYGQPKQLPISETSELSATNPYGHTKLIIEDMLRGHCHAQPHWNVVLLRYFNPVGAHPSGLIGESPCGIPNNLFPYIAQVASGKLAELKVYGGDYPTPDGTGVRDYIHVCDLAEGHVRAVEQIDTFKGAVPLNLGTGRGYSVLDAIRAFEKASARQVPHRIVGRRPGDVAACYADPSQARERLRWIAKRDLDSMCADAWRWQNAINQYI